MDMSPSEQWVARNQAELESEPKDDSWAYFMEQSLSLSQFMGGHPLISQFDVLHVECRTTFCQIQVVGFDDSTWPNWLSIMYDLRQEPWAEFYESGSSQPW